MLSLILVVAIAVIAWRWLSGTAVFSQDDDAPADRTVSTTTEPAATGDAAAAVTTLEQPVPSTGPPGPTVSSPTTTVASERRVLIRGEMKPCRFGSSCLVASFTIEGFDPHPGRFECIYPNSRRDFGFNNDGVDDACFTADDGDTIIIEIDGVRSATISEANLDGA